MPTTVMGIVMSMNESRHRRKNASVLVTPSAGPPLRWTAQNLALFFAFSHHHFLLFSFFCSLLVEFWWCF